MAVKFFKGGIYGFSHAHGHSSIKVKSVDEDYVRYRKYDGEVGNWSRKVYKMPIRAAKKRFWSLN